WAVLDGVLLKPTAWPMELIALAVLTFPPGRTPRSIMGDCAAAGRLTTAMLARIIVDKTRLKRVKRGRCLLRRMVALLRRHNSPSSRHAEPALRCAVYHPPSPLRGAIV